MTVFIQGIGAVGGFGSGVSALERALITGDVPPAMTRVETPDGTVQVPALLANTSPLNNFIAPRALRRISHYVQMSLLACYLALEDADMLQVRPRRMGIIAATGYGSTCNRFDFQTGSEEDEDICYSPTQFSNSVHNAAAAYISVFLKEHGPSLSINHFDMSIASAFLTAWDWIETNRVDAVLAGGVDEYSKAMGLYRHRVIRGEDGSYPADMIPAIAGEGSVFFLLTGDAAPSKGYGHIQKVTLGNLNTRKIVLPENAAFILGADGYSPCDKIYPSIIPENASAAVYPGLYGSLPVGMGFDAAIAAVSLKRGRLYGSSPDALNILSRHITLSDQELKVRSLCCLKLSPSDAFGLMTISNVG